MVVGGKCGEGVQDMQIPRASEILCSSARRCVFTGAADGSITSYGTGIGNSGPTVGCRCHHLVALTLIIGSTLTQAIAPLAFDACLRLLLEDAKLHRTGNGKSGITIASGMATRPHAVGTRTLTGDGRVW